MAAFAVTYDDPAKFLRAVMNDRGSKHPTWISGQPPGQAQHRCKICDLRHMRNPVFLNSFTEHRK
jgi:hypothetical protein